MREARCEGDPGSESQRGIRGGDGCEMSLTWYGTTSWMWLGWRAMHVLAELLEAPSFWLQHRSGRRDWLVMALSESWHMIMSARTWESSSSARGSGSSQAGLSSASAVQWKTGGMVRASSDELCAAGTVTKDEIQ